MASDGDDLKNYSAHYVGDRGKAYFRYQNEGGAQQGRVEARKFAPYISYDHVVLDFGCGNGTLLLNVNCKKRVGVEINPAAREAADLQGLETHETLSTIPDGSIDIAISNHAIEHVPNPVAALRSIRSKLVFGGMLVVCVPLDDWRTQQRVNVNDKNRHLYTWTPLIMGNLLDESGYTVQNVWVYTHAWPPYIWRYLDAHLPVWLFNLTCRVTAWCLRRRQVMALACNL